MNVTVRCGSELLPAAWRFATWADVGWLQGWVESLGTDSSSDMRDSADFARQAVARWRAYADKSLAASSVEDVRRRSAECPDEEFAVLLVLTSDWWFRPDRPLAFSYFRRTWCGGFYLEFMAAHPLTEGRIADIVRATMHGMLHLAQAAGGEWVWWEATKNSFPRYQKIIQQENLLGSARPPVRDVFVVRTTGLAELLNEKTAVTPMP